MHLKCRNVWNYAEQTNIPTKVPTLIITFPWPFWFFPCICMFLLHTFSTFLLYYWHWKVFEQKKILYVLFWPHFQCPRPAGSIKNYYFNLRDVLYLLVGIIWDIGKSRYRVRHPNCTHSYARGGVIWVPHPAQGAAIVLAPPLLHIP